MDRDSSQAPWVYSDGLIKLSENEIAFKHFGLLGGEKILPLDWIKEIRRLKPTVRTGKYRFHGSSGITTWFPLDFARDRRSVIFEITFNRKWNSIWKRIGFTVENEAAVMDWLRRFGKLADGDWVPESLDTKGDIRKVYARNKRLIITSVILGLLMLILMCYVAWH
jgi:hypothetical protein